MPSLQVEVPAGEMEMDDDMLVGVPGFGVLSSFHAEVGVRVVWGAEIPGAISADRVWANKGLSVSTRRVGCVGLTFRRERLV